MTDAEAKALGLRALAAGFRWAPGCLTWWRLFDEDDYHGVRLHGWTDDYSRRPEDSPVVEGYNQTENEHGAWEYPAAAGCWPDFRDDATLGVLVSQVRERSKDPGAYALPYGADDAVHWWCVYVWDKAREMRLHRGRYSDEAGAWVAALEAA